MEAFDPSTGIAQSAAAASRTPALIHTFTFSPLAKLSREGADFNQLRKALVRRGNNAAQDYLDALGAATIMVVRHLALATQSLDTGKTIGLLQQHILTSPAAAGRRRATPASAQARDCAGNRCCRTYTGELCCIPGTGCRPC